MNQRIARWFANGIRSWPFFFVFLTWSIAWWAYAGDRFGDPRPWLIWSLVTTFITEIDLIIYGIYQRRQSADDELMQRNQLDTMKLVALLAQKIEDSLERMDESVDRLLDLATNEETIQRVAIKQEESLHATMASIQAILEARTEVFKSLLGERAAAGPGTPLGEADVGS